MRTGFTLLEVVVALLIGAVAITAGAMLFAGLDDRAAAIERGGRVADHAGNGEGLVRSLMADLDVGGAATAPLTGSGRDVRFRTWCQDTRGWLDRCTAHLELRGGTGTSSLWLSLTSRETTVIDLRDDVHRGAMLYLRDVAGRGTWSTTWTTLVPPHAVLIITDDDSLFLPVASGA